MPPEEVVIQETKDPTVEDLFTPIEQAAARRGVKAFFWGEWKTGKTYSSLTFPGDVYVVDTEGGTAPLKQHFKGRNINIMHCGKPFGEKPTYKSSGKEEDKPFAVDPVLSLREVEKATLALANKDWSNGGTIIVDSVSDIWEWIQSWLKYNAKYSTSAKSGKEFMMQTEWQHANAMYRVILDRLLKLPVHVVLTSRSAPIYQDGQITQATKAKAQANTQYWVDVIVKFARRPMPESPGSTTMVNKRVATIESSRYGDPANPSIEDFTYEKLKTAFEGLAPEGVFT